MVFSSTTFLFAFLPITLLIYYILGRRFKNIWLLVMSLVFFSWSQLSYLWIILSNIFINYCGALLITKKESQKKLILVITVICNLLILYYYKYFDFTIESLNDLFALNLKLHEIILPIGISFFTFQGLSYVIDVYRGVVPVQKNLLKLALYIVSFPQLIAGPIVRYKDIAQEIDNRRNTLNDIALGVERFIIGLAKKVLIANSMASTVDTIWGQGIEHLSTGQAWVGSIAYSFQIFFDFSGYSDMAIGLGLMLGFHFNENFNYPYISKSISEFWRRWHISLSSWFKDYVYIPLGGNRNKVYRNLSFVFLLTGVWHGAAWHYIVWGIWHGAFILIERFCREKQIFERLKNCRISFFLAAIYALMAINLGWVIFRAPTLRDALIYIGTMFGAVTPEQIGYTTAWFLDRWTVLIFILGFLFSIPTSKYVGAFLRKRFSVNLINCVKYILLLGLLFISIMKIISGTYNPFIYFQF